MMKQTSLLAISAAIAGLFPVVVSVTRRCSAWYLCPMEFLGRTTSTPTTTITYSSNCLPRLRANTTNPPAPSSVVLGDVQKDRNRSLRFQLAEGICGAATHVGRSVVRRTYERLDRVSENEPPPVRLCQQADQALRRRRTTLAARRRIVDDPRKNGRGAIV